MLKSIRKFHLQKDSLFLFKSKVKPKKSKITSFCLGVLEKPLVKGHLKCRCAQLELDRRLKYKAAWLMCLFLTAILPKLGWVWLPPALQEHKAPPGAREKLQEPGTKASPKGPLLPVPKAWQVIRTQGSAEGWKLNQGFPNKGVIFYLLPMLTPPFLSSYKHVCWWPIK